MKAPEALESEREYLAVALQAMRPTDGDAGLDALGWWDLLPHLDDADLRTAVFAVFRAQGRNLASSSALGGLLAQPFLDGTAIAPGSVLATVRRGSIDGRSRHVVFGDPSVPLRIVGGPDVRWTIGVGRPRGALPINHGWIPMSVDAAQRALSEAQYAVLDALRRT